MKKNILKLGLVISYLLLFSSLCFALDVNGTPTKYEVRMQIVKVYNSDTAEWVTVYNDPAGSLALDIASVSSGYSAGTFAAGLVIPDGTYTKCRVTPARTFKIKGTIADGSDLYYTTSGTIGDGTSPIERTASIAYKNVGPAQDCNVVVLDSDVVETESDFSAPVTITNGIADHKIRVNFNMSSAIAVHTFNAGFIILPNPPTVTISIIDK